MRSNTNASKNATINSDAPTTINVFEGMSDAIVDEKMPPDVINIVIMIRNDILILCNISNSSPRNP